MISVILGVLLSCLQSFGGAMFFDLFQRRRRTGVAFWGVYLPACVCLALVLNIAPIASRMIRILLSVLFFFGANCALYHGRLLLRGFLVCLYYGLLSAVETAWIYFVLWALSISLQEYVASYAIYTYASIAVELIFLIVLVIAKRLRTAKNTEKVNWRFWCIPILVVSGSMCLITFLTLQARKEELLPQFVLPVAVFLVCTNILIIALVDWLESEANAREDALTLQERLRSSRQGLDVLQNAYETQRRMTHEYTSHLIALSGLLSEKQVEPAQEYIQQLLHQQTDRILFVRTGHGAMDALLNQKAHIAIQKDIDIRFSVSDLSELVVDIGDLCIVIGNLLDNAIEASEHLDESDREIKVYIALQDQLSFSVRNRCLPVTVVGDRIATTKADAGLHGYGLGNVLAVLSKYDHIRDMGYSDGWFHYTFEIPNIRRS